jgi:putative flippase GtrA
LPRINEVLFETMNYGSVVVLGFALDVSTAFALNQLFSVTLVLSAASGFMVGVAFNYVLFETWVFRSGQLSFSRLGRTYVVGLAAVLVRLGCVATLGCFPNSTGPLGALFTLLLATGCSFFVNFLLLKRLLGHVAHPGGVGS